MDILNGYLTHLKRLHRWIRGDYQILPFLKKKELSKLSKFKIIDNIRRSLIELAVILNIAFLVLSKVFLNVNIAVPLILSVLSVIVPSVIEAVNYIVFRKENIKRQKSFTKSINGFEGSFYRGLLAVLELPTKAYISLDALVRTIYRMYISREHLLEWTTSEEAEKQSKNSLSNVLNKMFPNIILGFAFFALGFWADISAYFKLFLYVISTLFIATPFIMWDISKEKVYIKKIEKLNKDETEYVKELAKKTWGYFAEYMNQENSFLPPDNFQESRREKIVNRTSSTNIGLGVLTIISAYDLKFIDLEKAIASLENTLDTIRKLEKWNGHLYNWYNTKTLVPLTPRYVSTVDSRKFYPDICTL